MDIRADAEELGTLTQLYVTRTQYPESRGLISLESKLLRSSCISMEGLGKTIANKYNRFVDKVIVKLNQVAGVFTQLTNEEKTTLKKINSGEISSKDVSLPITRRTIGNFLKFVGVVLAWVSMGSLTRYVTRKFKASRENDEQHHQERKALQNELNHYESMLKEKGQRMGNKEAAKEKAGVFSTLAKAAYSVKDRLTGVKWEEVEKAAAQTRSKLAANKGASDTKLNVKSAFRSISLGAILAAWIGMTVWLVNKVITFFKKISAKFGGESTTRESSDDDHDLYGNGY